MAVAVLGKRTVGSILVLQADKSPATDGGVSAPVGSYAFTTDNSGVFYKHGAGDTAWMVTSRKYVENAGFTISVAKTITHNLNTTAISISLWDANTGLAITPAALGNRTVNTVDITLGATLASVDVIITG